MDGMRPLNELEPGTLVKHLTAWYAVVNVYQKTKSGLALQIAPPEDRSQKPPTFLAGSQEVWVSSQEAWEFMLSSLSAENAEIYRKSLREARSLAEDMSALHGEP